MSDVVYHADLLEFVKDLERAASEDAAEIADDVINLMAEDVAHLAREYAPKDTRELERSIGVDHGFREARVFASAPHAVFIEFGTWSHNTLDPKPGTYEIKPRNAKALRFEIDGRTVFAKSVRHPGIEPQPFLGPALQDTLHDFTEGIADVGVLLIMGKI